MLITKIQKYINKYKIDSIIIPIYDEYKKYKTNINENLLQNLTGFSGSNAFVIFNNKNFKHAFFTDGRYLAQAKFEVNLDEFDIYDISTISIEKYLDINNLIKIGYNPYILNNSYLPNRQMIAIKELTELSRICLTHISTITNYDPIFSGATVKEKLDQLDFKTNYLFLNNAESINWLLNIRGNDIADTPVKLGYAFVTSNKEIFFFCKNPDKNIKIYNTTILDISELENFIKNISQSSIQLDIRHTSQYFLDNFQNIHNHTDTCLLLRSIKNNVEQACSEEIHLQDGLAVLKFIFWLKNQTNNISEIDVRNKLLELRSKNKNFISKSFDTIAGYAENSALIHYCPSEKTNKIIYDDNILLVDSGGHYLGGTTDITRSFHLGTASSYHKSIYTKVLKGHIALANLIFPTNTRGYQIDSIARQYLWQDELNYAHGTGHGVGNCLSVHEGPISISSANINHPLKDGMIVSIEPGCYFDGEFGIRLENLYLLCKSGNSFLKFKYLTMVPFEVNLIDFNLLTEQEKSWLLNYHKIVFNNLSSLLSENEKKWYESNYIKPLHKY